MARKDLELPIRPVKGIDDIMLETRVEHNVVEVHRLFECLCVAENSVCEPRVTMVGDSVGCIVSVRVTA